jgi:hypothetical protein
LRPGVIGVMNRRFGERRAASCAVDGAVPVLWLWLWLPEQGLAESRVGSLVLFEKVRQPLGLFGAYPEHHARPAPWLCQGVADVARYRLRLLRRQPAQTAPAVPRPLEPFGCPLSACGLTLGSSR